MELSAEIGHGGGGRLAPMVLAALGIVYGDIGTSPLYTLRECFGRTVDLPLTEANVLGILSLILWSLVLVVTVKYVIVIMRADNRGEGGILALMTLALRNADPAHYPRATLTVLGMFGAALFFGDGLITPAISVLGAVEGLKVAAPSLSPWILPLTLVILLGLFLVQRGGTSRVGRLFGPVMAVWFLVLGGLGAAELIRAPDVLRAASPGWAAAFALENGWLAFVALGSVVLAVTGAEALYADMGHLGRAPIRVAWLGLVLPALLLNYFGQGALLLHDPAALEHPFFHLAPDWGALPLLLLAAAATVIASQAVISGAFSVARQAIQLGLIPRMRVRHTSAEEIGQIYIPRLNWLLCVLVVTLVLGFGSSSSLASAYGLAVTGEMTIASVLGYVVARTLWGWSRLWAVPALLVFMAIDLSFFGANLLKVADGGWFPLLAGVTAFTLMATWRRGREIVFRRLAAQGMEVDLFVRRCQEKPPLRVPGTAIFLTGSTRLIPHALLHNLKHNKVLHERVILLTVKSEEVPRVDEARRIEFSELGQGFHRVILRFGFVEEPHVPQALKLLAEHHLPIDLMSTSFFLGRETIVPSTRPDLPHWQERIFVALSTTAIAASDFFCIPANRVVELGTQIEV
ncbi:potassium transporter Kup [Arenibaculum pallidiluteum]|uniref:potassium transporter Kup n=1 Tax=Arenibaculum pallidiluteum TaxID=2812559 RepID=UPI001A97342C|nr:potassium transporter Kup [Arenibaculum pallidiluteum]